MISALQTGAEAERGGSFRVLIADDEANIRQILARALRSSEYELLIAPHGQEALRLFEEIGADVIISDVSMPFLDGLELLREVRALDDTVGFIMLTGAGTLESAIDALRLAADDYLRKPFNVEEVRLSVARVLEHRRLVLENRFYQQHLEERVQEQAVQIEALWVDALLSLSNAIEARDGYTGGHVERVTRYATATGREMGLVGEALRHLWMAALLHDVGKIGVPDSILRKPGGLTVDEYAEMQKHPLIGAAIVERSTFLRPALAGVLHHQERWDGTGYPEGLKAEQISLEGRILSVADTFDAIVSTRPYRARRSAPVALAEIRRCAGTQFDPAVVEAFARAFERGFPEPANLPALPSPSAPG